MEILTRDATLMALVSFWIADRPDRLASPWSAEKTAKMLVEKKDDQFLKAEGLWPFGDLGGSSTSEPDKEAKPGESAPKPTSKSSASATQ